LGDDAGHCHAGPLAPGWIVSGWIVSVNQMIDHLNSPDWRHRLADLMGQAGLLELGHNSVLQIELTEGQVAGPMDMAMAQLQDLGVRLAVDDFGTGHSNLSYLRSLPISTLKSDGAFVQGIESDANLRVLVDAMLGLGKSRAIRFWPRGSRPRHRMASCCRWAARWVRAI
jgi:EAL domain-containing protein (putative c-di-GMP-specific phosphodiesterase class I)